MKKTTWIVLAILITSVAAIPYIDGYIFKKIYTEKIAYYNSQLRDDKMQLKIESYKIGWLESTAQLAITELSPPKNTSFQLPPIVIRVTSKIHHGPLVSINGKFRFASAYVKTQINLPDVLKIVIPQNTDSFLQIESMVSLNGNQWQSAYIIPAITSSAHGGWDGLSGNIIVDSIHAAPYKITNETQFGKLTISPMPPFVPGLSSSPIIFNTTATQKYENIWVGNSKLKTDGMTVTWQDGSLFSINNLTMNSETSASNDLYNYLTNLTVAKMQLPATSPVTGVSDFKLAIALDNLNLNGMKSFKEYSQAVMPGADDTMQRNLLLGLLSPSTRLTTSTKMNTDLGGAATNLAISLLALPKNSAEIENNVNVDFNMRIAQPLFDKLLISCLIKAAMSHNYASAYSTEPMPLTQDQLAATNQAASDITTKLIELGYLVKDNTDYTMVYNRKGQENIFNGKAVTQESLSDLQNYLMQAINKPMMPAPTSVETPAETVLVHEIVPIAPAATGTMAPQPQNTSGLGCYWMESQSGQYRWVPIPNLSKSDCFNLDSCSGGLKQSGGGCYKWASSPDAQAQPW